MSSSAPTTNNSSDSLMAAIEESRATAERMKEACKEFDRKFNQTRAELNKLESTLGRLSKQNESLEKTARYGNITETNNGKEPTPEEQRAVFDGQAPSAQLIAQGIREGKYKHIVVLCGAGMSTSAGIPDFRSPETGVYALLKKEQEERRLAFSQSEAGNKKNNDDSSEKQQREEMLDRELPTPQSLFTLDFYRRNQMPFILRAGHIWPGKACHYRPTPSHCFLQLLLPHDQLLRVYTQNIDELETWTPPTSSSGDPHNNEKMSKKSILPREKIRRCHGSFETVHCTERKSCSSSYDRGSAEYEAVYTSMVVEGKPVPCPKCAPPAATLDKQPSSTSAGTGGAVMKPGIVFFGEAMSSEFGETKSKDFALCDLLIVMGTSLQVSPFCDLPDLVGPMVPRLLLNAESVGPFATTLKEAGATAMSTATRSGDGELSNGEEAKKPCSDDDQQYAGNYRDVAMLGDLDSSVHQLAEWMGEEKTLTSLCQQAECKKTLLSTCSVSKAVSTTNTKGAEGCGETDADASGGGTSQSSRGRSSQSPGPRKTPPPPASRGRSSGKTTTAAAKSGAPPLASKKVTPCATTPKRSVKRAPAK